MSIFLSRKFAMKKTDDQLTFFHKTLIPEAFVTDKTSRRENRKILSRYSGRWRHYRDFPNGEELPKVFYGQMTFQIFKENTCKIEVFNMENTF